MQKLNIKDKDREFKFGINMLPHLTGNRLLLMEIQFLFEFSSDVPDIVF